jgi:hypothetical protein
VVTEGAGGSTSQAAWFTRDEIDKLELTELARLAVEEIDSASAR